MSLRDSRAAFYLRQDSTRAIRDLALAHSSQHPPSLSGERGADLELVPSAWSRAFVREARFG